MISIYRFKISVICIHAIFKNSMNILFHCYFISLPINDTIFACFLYKIIFYISCALLSREIKRHPFHLQHPSSPTTTTPNLAFVAGYAKDSTEITVTTFTLIVLTTTFFIYSKCAFWNATHEKMEAALHALEKRGLALVAKSIAVKEYVVDCWERRSKLQDEGGFQSLQGAAPSKTEWSRRGV